MSNHVDLKGPKGKIYMDAKSLLKFIDRNYTGEKIDNITVLQLSQTRKGRERILKAHLKLIYLLCCKYRAKLIGISIDINDMFQEACMGFLHRLKGYNPIKYPNVKVTSHVILQMKQYLNLAMCEQYAWHTPVDHVYRKQKYYKKLTANMKKYTDLTPPEIKEITNKEVDDEIQMLSSTTCDYQYTNDKRYDKTINKQTIDKILSHPKTDKRAKRAIELYYGLGEGADRLTYEEVGEAMGCHKQYAQLLVTREQKRIKKRFSKEVI